MARPRLELQTLLEGIMSSYTKDSIQRVWYQPPSSVYLTYPCIIYTLSGKDHLRADNIKYRTMNRYTLTVIDRDPESSLPEIVENGIKYCAFDRIFSVDGLYHTTYTIYF